MLEPLAGAEQHHEHEDPPGDREAGERRAQLVALDGVEDLLPDVEADHPAAGSVAIRPEAFAAGTAARAAGGAGWPGAAVGAGGASSGSSASTSTTTSSGFRAALAAVAGDAAVDQVDEPVGHVGDVALVGDDHHRDAVVLDRLQHLHDVARGRRVERPGRLVGEQELGARDQRPGDGDTLLLAAGELRRQVLGAIGEADLLEVDRGALVALPARDALVVERQRDVLGRGLERDQVERLEDEADVLAAVLRRPGLGEAAHGDAVEGVLAVVETVEEAENVHQGRLARPGGAHHGDQLARPDVEVEPLEDVEPVAAHGVALVQISQTDHVSSRRAPACLTAFRARKVCGGDAGAGATRPGDGKVPPHGTDPNQLAHPIQSGDSAPFSRPLGAVAPASQVHRTAPRRAQPPGSRGRLRPPPASKPLTPPPAAPTALELAGPPATATRLPSGVATRQLRAGTGKVAPSAPGLRSLFRHRDGSPTGRSCRTPTRSPSRPGCR